MPPRFMQLMRRGDTEVQQELDPLTYGGGQTGNTLLMYKDQLMTDVSNHATVLFNKLYEQDPNLLFSIGAKDIPPEFVVTGRMDEIEDQHKKTIDLLKEVAHTAPEYTPRTLFVEAFAAARRHVALDKVVGIVDQGQQIDEKHHQAIQNIVQELSAPVTATSVSEGRTIEHDSYCRDVLSRAVAAASRKNGISSEKFSQFRQIYYEIADGRDTNPLRRATSSGLEALRLIADAQVAPDSRLRNDVESLRHSYESGKVSEVEFQLYERLLKTVGREFVIAQNTQFASESAPQEFRQSGHKADLLKELSITLGYPVTHEDDLSPTAEPRTSGQGVIGRLLGISPATGVVRPETSGVRVEGSQEGGKFGGATVVRLAAVTAMGAGVAATPIHSTAFAETPVPTMTAAAAAFSSPTTPETGRFITGPTTADFSNFKITVSKVQSPIPTSGLDRLNEVSTTHEAIVISTEIGLDGANDGSTFIEPQTTSPIFKTPQEQLADEFNSKDFDRVRAYDKYKEILTSELDAKGETVTSDVTGEFEEQTSPTETDTSTEALDNFKEEVYEYLAALDETYRKRASDLPEGAGQKYLLATLDLQGVLDNPEALAAAGRNPSKSYDSSQAAEAFRQLLKAQFPPELAEQIGENRYKAAMNLLAASSVSLMGDQQKQNLINAVFPQKSGNTHRSGQQQQSSHDIERGVGSQVDQLSSISQEQKEFLKKVALGVILAHRSGAKINPQVTIAQAILESGWGDSKLAQHNNLFGMKAGGSWKGKTITLPTTEYDANGSPYQTDAVWRVYPNIEASIEDYAKNFIGGYEWYADARKFADNPSKYLDGLLGKIGPNGEIIIPQGEPGAMSYATDPSYKKKILGMIGSYNLNEIVNSAENVNNHGNGNEHTRGKYFESGEKILNHLKAKYDNVSGKLDKGELTIIGPAFSGHQLFPAAARSFRLLDSAFENEFGYHIGITDSYRSYEAQVAAKEDKPDLAATPGTSNHGWGMALDMGEHGVNDYNSPQHKWLRKNAPKFGWDLPWWARSTEEAQAYARAHGKDPSVAKQEPWHWEYVGDVRIRSQGNQGGQHKHKQEHGNNHETQAKFKGPMSKRGYTTPIDEKLYLQMAGSGTPYDGYQSISGVHTGMDIPVDFVPFRAVRGGRVVRVGEIGLDIYAIEVAQDDGYFAVYEHVKPGSAAVKVGDHVKIGEHLGTTGNSGYTTGASTGPHLHLSIQNVESIVSKSDGDVYATTDDPMDYLPSYETVRRWLEHHG